MDTPNPFKRPPGTENGPVDRNAKTTANEVATEFAASLDDFMDEEVLDSRGKIVGALACYWHSVSGRLLFLGIRVDGHKSIRIVPGLQSQMDETHSCIRLGFTAPDIESAPHFTCEEELDSATERAVYEHFGEEPEPHDGLLYFGRKA